MTVDEQIIGGYHGANAPFISSLHLIRKSDVVNVLDPVRNPLHGNHYPYIPFGGLRLKQGAKLHKFKFPPQTCTMQRTTLRSASGVRSAVVFEYPMPGSRHDVEDWAWRHREEQLVALAETPAGTVWLVGNEERGMRFSLVQNIAAISEHFFTVSGEFNLPLFVMEPVGIGADLKVLFPDTDFSTEFSLDFNA